MARAPLAGYVRVSRVGDRGERLISPELQRERIESYARARELKIVMLDPELDVSGGKAERPVLDEILAGVESGRFGGIIVAQLDRLSRLSLADAHKIIERIEGAGGLVVAVAESFDATTPEGELGRDVMLSIARMQRSRYAAAFAAAKERAVRQGIWPLPVVPVGYRKGTDRRLEPDPGAAPRVVRAFELRARGGSWRQVAELLGCGNSAAGRVIRNRVYLGEIRYGEWLNLSAHPPIVDRGLFEVAQIAHPRPARGRAGPALLAGLCRCAACRGLLTPDTLSYRCQGDRSRASGRCPAPALIAKSIIEPYVERVFLALAGDVEASTLAEGRDVDAEKAKLADAEAELTAFQRATSAVALGAEHFAEGLRLRVEAVEQARRGLAEARLALAPVERFRLAASWTDLDVIERRHVLRSSLGVIWVRRGRGPASGRVKIVATEPPGLPRPGWGRTAIEPIDWDGLDALVEPGA